MHSVPRNKTNRYLKVERSPKVSRVKVVVSHWISLSLCDNVSDIDSYKLLQSSIASVLSLNLVSKSSGDDCGAERSEVAMKAVQF